MQLDELRGRDDIFIQMALRKGQLTPEQVTACRAAQDELASRGQLVPIRKILKERGYLREAGAAVEAVTTKVARALAPREAGPAVEAATTKVASPPPPGGGSGASPALKRFGKYLIVEEIARGRMGIVYKARQEGLDRLVALKVLIAGEDATQEQVERFHREAQLAANLRHPGIVPIHDVGVHEGKHYFTMDYVEGETLTAAIGRKGIGAARACEIMLPICEALGHAHAQGIVHRDLKPSNVMIDGRGAPQVMDFGLAREVETSGSRKLTRSGTSLGTPQYMSPEQAAGRARHVDAASDVYAMGAILYELLTGRPPFGGSNVMNILFAVINKDPAAPRRLNPRIPRDLETICLKAMEKEKGRRYASARQMGADLERYVNGQPIMARPPSLGYRLGKWVARNRALASGCGLFAVAATVGTALALSARKESDHQISKLSAEKRKKEEEARRSEKARAELEKRRELERKVKELLAEARRLETNKAAWGIHDSQKPTISCVP